jgi:hypothetical protein
MLSRLQIRTATAIDEDRSMRGSSRNPPWTREELTLALALYVDVRDNFPSSANDARVAALSRTLNSLPRPKDVFDNLRFRNPNAAYMKLCNFRRFDPRFLSKGRVGLRGGGKLEQSLWDEYATSPDLLRRDASLIGVKLDSENLSVYNKDYSGDSYKRVVINDLDPAIYAFWSTLTKEPKWFVDQINAIPLNVEEWRRQRAIYLVKNKRKSRELGFALFYLNRTNRSGIVEGWPIGGLDQSGPWKIDARFNRLTIADKIERLGEYAGRIQVTNMDGMELARKTMLV